MTVVIAGCGDVGTEAGLRYVGLGRTVMGLRRSPEVLPDAFMKQAIDLSTEVPALPSDTTTVVLATSADGRSEAAYRSAYVSSASNVLAAIERDCARPPRVLLISSTAVYDIDDGSQVDEDTPASPGTPTSTMLIEAENVLRSALDHVVVLRLGGIYGPGRGRMIDQARSGFAGPPGSHFTNRIHRDDAAAAIVHLTTIDAPEQLYLGVDNDPADREDVLQFLAAELGVDRPASSPTSDPTTGKQCANSRLRASGFDFDYPTFREGYRAVLAGQGMRHP